MAARAAHGSIDRHARIEEQRATELDKRRRYGSLRSCHVIRQRSEQAARVTQQRIVLGGLGCKCYAQAHAQGKRDGAATGQWFHCFHSGYPEISSGLQGSKSYAHLIVEINGNRKRISPLAQFVARCRVACGLSLA
jgi:hypothetical protein